jgi:adenylosuccinate synthase
VQELGQEFGTVTGRERRCGWLDLVALRFAVRVNGITSLALTKLDVLSDFAALPVCVRYRLEDGTETEDMPAHQRIPPPPGFRTLAVAADRHSAAGQQAYVSFVEEALDVPVTLVGTGAARRVQNLERARRGLDRHGAARCSRPTRRRS